MYQSHAELEDDGESGGDGEAFHSHCHDAASERAPLCTTMTVTTPLSSDDIAMQVHSGSGTVPPRSDTALWLRHHELKGAGRTLRWSTHTMSVNDQGVSYMAAGG